MKEGRWKKGESGNPSGRTPGSGEVGRLRALISQDIPEIIQKLVEQAKAGDSAAARLLIERVLPPIKASEQPVAIDFGEGSLTDQGRAVLMAAGQGELSPSQAAQMLSGLGSLAKLVETEEILKRLEALEQASRPATEVAHEAKH